MTRALQVIRCRPGITVQDSGRTGRLDNGLSAGGMADPLAFHEGAALLGQSVEAAALELAGTGGVFEATTDMRIALTGAPVRADIDGKPIACNASHWLKHGQALTLGHALRGNYSYLHVGGGFDTPVFLESRSTHLAARIGELIKEGTVLPVAEDAGDQTGLALDTSERFCGGILRIVPSVQTGQFDTASLARLEETRFTRDPRGNRMGVRMAFEGPPFSAERQLDTLSESVVPGDIQIVGDGTPFVLLGECQTTGGYPRIGTVIPPDIPLVAQARLGDPIRFRFIDRNEAITAYRCFRSQLATLPQAARPLVREPHDIPDLLAYQLIDGAITGNEEDSHEHIHRP